jgi:8-amino-7-oxononanoate synthase
MTSPRERLLAALARGLAAREQGSRLRRLAPRSGIDLSSNDVLGFTRDPWIAERVADAVRRHGTGSGAARLLGGNHALLEEAEARLAAFSGREAALLFPAGYLANLGLLGAVLRTGGTWLSDRDNHASLVDGLRLARAAQGRVGLLDDPADPVWDAPSAPGLPHLAVLESVVSTSGRMPRLDTVCARARETGAVVAVDEAHATGILGPGGAGLVAAAGLTGEVLATVHTGGKALGVAGAWVAGERMLIEHLVNHARTFVFTTAPMPALAAGLIAALERLAQMPGAAAETLGKAARLRARLRAAGVPAGGEGTHLVPVVLGADARAVSVAEALQADGFDVRALRPPTVPVGAAQLRIVVRHPTPESELERFAERLVHHVRALPSERSAP